MAPADRREWLQFKPALTCWGLCLALGVKFCFDSQVLFNLTRLG